MQNLRVGAKTRGADLGGLGAILGGFGGLNKLKNVLVGFGAKILKNHLLLRGRLKHPVPYRFAVQIWVRKGIYCQVLERNCVILELAYLGCVILELAYLQCIYSISRVS